MPPQPKKLIQQIEQMLFAFDPDANNAEQPRESTCAAIARRTGVSEATVRAIEKEAFERIEAKIVFNALLVNFISRIQRGDFPPDESVNDDEAFLQWLNSPEAHPTNPYGSCREFLDDPVFVKSKRATVDEMFFTLQIPRGEHY